MLIITIAVVIVLSAAAGCGIGGAGLLVVYMTLVLDSPQLTAQATNLLFYIISAFSSAVVQRKKHTLPPFKLIALCSGCAIPGILLGTVLRSRISPDNLRTFFGFILVAAGLSVLWSSVKKAVSNSRSGMSVE